MARWRLAAPHYLNVSGTQWQYTEVDRNTGKQKRTLFEVPLLLDPNQPSDWNYKHNQDEGEIIVSNGGTSESRDIIFSGDPTADMIPLDDEAKAISSAMAPKWANHPIESLKTTYSDAILSDLQIELAKVQSQSSSTKVEGMQELLGAIASMMKQNQDILSALVPKVVEDSRRRA